jgi:UDP-glucose 4-epimerase
LATERYLAYFKRKHQLDSLILRIGNAYGPRQSFSNKQGVIPLFLENIEAGKSIRIIGSGNCSRDYIYVEDVAEITVRLATQKSPYEVYNVSSGKNLSLKQIVAACEKVTNKNAKLKHISSPASFVEHSKLNVSRLKNVLGSQLKLTSLEHGLEQTIEYIRRESAPAAETPSLNMDNKYTSCQKFF